MSFARKIELLKKKKKEAEKNAFYGGQLEETTDPQTLSCSAINSYVYGLGTDCV